MHGCDNHIRERGFIIKHHNGALLCAIDTETTGTDCSKHEIIEICILPLDANYGPSQVIMPFQLDIKPDKPENIDFEALRVMRQCDDFYLENVCKDRKALANATMRGMDKSKAADLLVEWFENLKLGMFKTFEYIFDPRYRDTMGTSLFLNDVADMMGEKYPYPKNNLQYLCSELKVERERSHTAVDDCVATAEVYRRMINRTC